VICKSGKYSATAETELIAAAKLGRHGQPAEAIQEPKASAKLDVQGLAERHALDLATTIRPDDVPLEHHFDEEVEDVSVVPDAEPVPEVGKVSLSSSQVGKYRHEGQTLRCAPANT
jgi:hypothetical protein